MRGHELPCIYLKIRYGICIMDISHRNHVKLYCGLVNFTRSTSTRFIQIKNYKIAQTDGFCGGKLITEAVELLLILIFIIHTFQKSTSLIVTGLVLDLF